MFSGLSQNVYSFYGEKDDQRRSRTKTDKPKTPKRKGKKGLTYGCRRQF